MKSLINISVLGTALAFAVTCLIPVRVAAQNVNRKAIERTTWHTAPREFQIVDDTPIIRDFREAPQNAGQIAMPPGPSANSGGGHGAGALGPLGGGAPTIPAGGMPLPGNGPGYRTNPSSIPNLGTLPKTGFGGSNIPARGMGPRGLLPNGTTQNVIGRLMAQKKPVPAVAAAAGPAKGLSAPAARSAGNTAGPAVASYGGGSGSGIGPDYGGNANRTETFVRGSLLRK